jgi:hypothetical protein
MRRDAVYICCQIRIATLHRDRVISVIAKISTAGTLHSLRQVGRRITSPTNKGFSQRPTKLMIVKSTIVAMLGGGGG